MKHIVNQIFILVLIVGCSNNNKEKNTVDGLAGNEDVANFIRQFEGRGALTDNSEPTPPKEALDKFSYPDDLVLDLVLAEPMVRQPLALNFDHRGRLWVVQYGQYPYPEGLKITGMDNHFRVKYDKIPKPPPFGVSGADKITFFEDTNGDGIFNKSTDAITGLNIATSVAFGRGKIWVLNPPYLLAYPDIQGDGLPDGEPEVHLDGFGLEDTHAVANSLHWGPDGWLYGATGSTVTANISSRNSKNIEFNGQTIWRYHPEKMLFEVLAEGGGNTFHVEIDDKGRIFSGDNGTSRGPYFKQGAYYARNFGKHGPLTNPYAFGVLDVMKLIGDEIRFTHALVKYQGGVLPNQYEDQMIAINPLQNFVQLSGFETNGSNFIIRDKNRILETNDQWFRPVDIKVGPDGAVYIADWYDSRLSHVDPKDTWDKNSGRIYRLRSKNPVILPSFDISSYSNDQLVELLSHTNKWFRQQAQRQFGDRKQKEIIPKLKKILINKTGQLALEALWAINISGYLDDEIIEIGLGHVDPFVRMWSTRLSSDFGKISKNISKIISGMATNETNLEVRSQLASSAKRLPGKDAIPIIKGLMMDEKDALDPDIPLLIWWALEAKVETDLGLILKLFEDSSLWEKPIVKDVILERLVQRLVLAYGSNNLSATKRLFELAPKKEHVKLLLNGLQEGMRGKDMADLPVDLALVIKPYMEDFGNGPLSFSILQGDIKAIDKSLKIISNPQEDLNDRLAYIGHLGEIKSRKSIPVLLSLVESEIIRVSIRIEALQALTSFKDVEIGIRVTRAYPSARSNKDLRNSFQELIASRASWTKEFLKFIVSSKQIDPDDVSVHIVQKFIMLNDPNVSNSVKKLWPEVQLVSSSDKDKEMQRIASIIDSNSGNAKTGQILFQNLCGACHRLFDKGGTIGPDLTGYDRKNINYLLFSIIDPNADIREGYVNYKITLKDGQILVGKMANRSSKSITLMTYNGDEIIIPTDQIELMEGQTTSLMPERLLSNLSDEQVQNLFAYIMQITNN